MLPGSSIVTALLERWDEVDTEAQYPNLAGKNNFTMIAHILCKVKIRLRLSGFAIFLYWALLHSIHVMFFVWHCRNTNGSFNRQRSTGDQMQRNMGDQALKNSGNQVQRGTANQMSQKTGGDEPVVVCSLVISLCRLRIFCVISRFFVLDSNQSTKTTLAVRWQNFC